MMKAVIINSSDIFGGAGLAGYTLCKALNAYTDFDTEILCGTKRSSDKFVTQILSGKTFRLHSIFKHRLPNIPAERLPHVRFKILKWVREKKPDIINLHNIHGGYFPYSIISKLSRIAPIIVSMQDMWFLTGHCAYSYECNKWQRGCVKCPHKDWYEPIAFTSAASHWMKKRELFRNSNITFVTCSQWFKNKAETSPMLAGKKVRHIYNPIDTDVLKPLDCDIARYMLGIPSSNILAYGAANIGDPRKGFEKFVKSIPETFVKNHNIFILIMGKDYDGLIGRMPKYIPYKHIEDANNPLVRAIVYAAADVFVFPTLADNLPNMLIEALSCGRRVVTFDVGGCGEVIINNKTGYLAKYANYADFKYGIELLLNDICHRETMEQQCRLFATSNFSMKSCAEKYANVFREMLK